MSADGCFCASCSLWLLFIAAVFSDEQFMILAFLIFLLLWWHFHSSLFICPLNQHHMLCVYWSCYFWQYAWFHMQAWFFYRGGKLDAKPLGAWWKSSFILKHVIFLIISAWCNLIFFRLETCCHLVKLYICRKNLNTSDLSWTKKLYINIKKMTKMLRDVAIRH